MRANTIAPLASGKVVAGIIRSTLRCVLCSQPQFGSRYSVCPDCFAFNRDWLASAIGARALRCAEFDPFPSRAINLASAYRAARASNRSELAFKIAEYARSRRHLRALAPEHVPSDRDWRAWRAFMQRFVVSNALEDIVWRLASEYVEPGETPYPGESLLERFDISASEAERALRYPRADDEPAAECDRALRGVVSVACDLLERPRRFDRRKHEERVAAFLASHKPLDGTAVKSVRSYLRSRVFVGYRHRSGTYSFGFERTGATPRRPTLVWRAPQASFAAQAA